MILILTNSSLMMDNIDEVTDKRLETFDEIEKDDRRLGRAYNEGKN